jgi:solute carrier family 35 protein E1
MKLSRDSFLFECLEISFLCLVWYSSSAADNVIVKELLSEFPFPLTVTLVQLLSIWILCIPLIRLWKVPSPDYLYQNRIYYFKIIIPLAVGKFLAQLSSHVSLWKVPISYAHSIKATMPLFTVILSRIILWEKQTLPVYISLIPIIIGAIIATVTEISFNMTGLISALLSTFAFSLQNIYSKKSLKDIAIHHFILLSLLAKIGWCLFISFWFFYDGVDIYYNEKYVSRC